MFKITALLAIAVAAMHMFGTSAQTIPLSKQCQTTLLQLIHSPAGQCTNFGTLVGILRSTRKHDSLVPGITAWASGLCIQEMCNGDAFSDLIHGVTSGCQSELSSSGLSQIDQAQLAALLGKIFPLIYKSSCLYDSNNIEKPFCLKEYLTSIQPFVGDLTFSTIKALANGTNNATLSSVPSNVTCTDCVKGMYSALNGTLNHTSMGSYLQSTCGDSFIDGSTPGDVIAITIEDALAIEQRLKPQSKLRGINGTVHARSPIVGIVVSVLVVTISALLG